MTITPTALLSLPIITTGTESGTWGDVVDNGLTSYLDIAIAGGLAVSITGSGTTATLTNTAGTSSVTNIGSTTAQYAILNISGAKTGNCTLVLPSSSRRYTINNAGTSTGGPWTLTVKGAATTGITLIDGEKVNIAWNGTDYVKVGLSSQPTALITFPTTGSNTGGTTSTAGASTAPLATGTGAAVVNFSGIHVNPQLSVTDASGSASTVVYGAVIQPAILSTGDTTMLQVTGAYVNTNRSNGNDLSSYATSSVIGVNNLLTIGTTLPSTAVSNTVTGYQCQLSAQGGILGTVQGVYTTSAVYSTIGSNASGNPVSAVYGVRTSTTVGASSGTGFTVTNRYGVTATDTTAATATVTNYYGLYLTHTVAGTVTNRYGVYSADALATNYFAGAVLASGATGGLGYGTGSGGAVTQASSRTTGVTLSKNNGAITMFSAAGSTTAATFTVTNTLVAATDTIILNQKSGTNLYVLLVTAVAAGSFNVTFYTTGGTATDAPVINFALIKAVTA
jgi:hypothetical protein